MFSYISLFFSYPFLISLDIWKRLVGKITICLERCKWRIRKYESILAVGDSSMDNFFSFNDNIKIDLSEFHDQFQLEEFFEWLNTNEKFFEYKKISEDWKIKSISIRLRCYISILRDKTEDMHLHKGKMKISS